MIGNHCTSKPNVCENVTFQQMFVKYSTYQQNTAFDHFFKSRNLCSMINHRAYHERQLFLHVKHCFYTRNNLYGHNITWESLVSNFTHGSKNAKNVIDDHLVYELLWAVWTIWKLMLFIYISDYVLSVVYFHGKRSRTYPRRIFCFCSN